MGGGSIAGALGLSPFHTPLDVYCEITGEMHQGVTPEKREFFDRRKAWEPMAREIFEKVTSNVIKCYNVRYDDAVFPWAKAEIDAETEDANIEFKTLRSEVRWLWEKPEHSEPPPYVTVQAMWGLGIRPKPMAYVHALDLDNDLIYEIPRDEETLAVVRDGAERFWRNHVEPRRPPAPVDVGDILRLYGRGTERAVEATDEVKEALAERAKAVSNIKLQDADQLKAELVIKQFMRDASVLTINGKQVATWKADARGIRIFRQK